MASSENEAVNAEPAPSDPVALPQRPAASGPPVWLPLLAGVIALAAGLFVFLRIGPTLSGMISPPDPVLPPASVLESKESKGTEDQWLYRTPTSACEVARFYQTVYGTCIFDPASGCNGAGNNMDTSASGASVARCIGNQQIGQFRLLWTIFIATDNKKDQRGTVFRVYREVN